jgi:hypothetical protein
MLAGDIISSRLAGRPAEGVVMRVGAFGAILLLSAVIPGVAEARAHDDVMTGAFRCASVGNGRQWLDCYYGAAQPLRSQLGLPAAPQAQIALATAPPAGGAMGPAEAQARDEVMSEAFHCTTIDNDRQWLDCYYGAAQPMRTQLKLPPAPQARIAMAAPTPGASLGAGRNLPMPAPRKKEGFLAGIFGSDEAASPGQFGLAAPPAPQDMPQNVKQIVSRIADYQFDRYGVVTLKLANGQVWRQVEGDTALAKLHLAPASYAVTIKHGFFGSYNMTIKGVPGLFRVQRIT